MAAGLVACEDDNGPRVSQIDDMIFIVDPLNAGPEPDSQMEAESNSSLDLYVARNAFIAIDYPKQDATVEVDEAKSTAVSGEDFELSATSFLFNGADNCTIPLTVDIREASGKKIVLNIIYPEYPSCPVAGRKNNSLEITIK